MSYHISGACVSNVGNVRDNNEDNFYFNGIYLDESNMGISDILSVDFLSTDNKVFAVFDGMGGQSKGERASFIAASTMDEYVKSHTKMKWDRFSKIVNEKVCDEMTKNKNRMGSTMAAVQFSEDSITISNLGDSRIYLLTNNSFGQISEDHTEAKLNENIIPSKNGKSRLTQYFGIREDEMIIQPFIKTIHYDNVERILICSDGITDMISDDKIEKYLINCTNSKECVDHLLKTALKNGGEDNTTVMVFNIEKEEKRIEKEDSKGFFNQLFNFFSK